MSPPRRPTGTTTQEPGDKRAANAKIRKVRNTQGTRVARAVVCSSCGKRDHIHFAPKDPARALCRTCAAEQLGLEDPDTEVRAARSFQCNECGRTVLTSKRPEVRSDIVCNDCQQGISSKQDNRSQTAERVSNKVIRTRRKRPAE